MAMLRLQFPIKIPGSQPGTFVYHNNDGFVYQKNRITETSVYFKCASYEGRRCHGRAVFNRRLGFLSKAESHNHNPDVFEAAERELIRKILDRCATPEHVSFRTIINQERLPYPIEVKRRVSLARLRPAMQRARRSIYPDPPQTLRELSEILRRQNRVITMTKDGRDNFYAGSVNAADGSHCIIFASRRMLTFASNNLDFLFGDGTFKVLPAIPDLTRASQVYNVVGNWNHHILPIACVIMTRRTEDAYNAVLQFLHALMNGAPTVSKIVTDFEPAAQNAWQENFPNATLQGCFFHTVRAFVRYAKEELLMTVHLRRADGPVRVLVRLCCAIPLLPRRFFRRGFLLIINEARNEGRRVYGIMRPFLDYVLRNWINNDHRNNLMSVYGSQHRTNNTCESHHRQLKKYMVVSHPNIYDFIGGVASIEEATWTDVNALQHGESVGRRRKATAIANDRRLRRLASDLREAGPGVRDPAILRYLRAAAYTFANAYDRAVEDE